MELLILNIREYIILSLLDFDSKTVFSAFRCWFVIFQQNLE